MIPWSIATRGIPIALDLTIRLILSMVSFLLMFFIGMTEARYCSHFLPPLSRKNSSRSATSRLMKKLPMPPRTDCPSAVSLPATKLTDSWDTMSMPNFFSIMSNICVAGAMMSLTFHSACWILSTTNQTISVSGTAMKSITAITMITVARVGFPSFRARRKVGRRSSMYSVRAQSTPLM